MPRPTVDDAISLTSSGSQRGSAALSRTGTEGDDRIEGAETDDTLYGLGGNDALNGMGGNDVLEGGGGDDQLYDRDGSNSLFGGNGNDVLSTTSTGTNLLDGGEGDDNLHAGAGTDTLLGGGGDDRLYLSRSFLSDGYDVVMDGGEGTDELVFNWGFVHDNSSSLSVTARGGAGADVFSVLNGHPGIVIDDFSSGDRLSLMSLLPPYASGNPFGASGYLRAVYENGATRVYHDEDGAVGQVHGFALAFTLTGVTLDALTGNSFVGGFGVDGANKGMMLTGTEGADVLTGHILDDEIRGGDGADRIEGAAGDDVIHGGDEPAFPGGGDVIDAGYGHDSVHGGAGDDDVDGHDGDDVLHGEAGNDRLQGGDGDDRLYGGDGNDNLSDHAGDDLLDGGAGDDIIHGGSIYEETFVHGTTIDGGAGNDRLYAVTTVTKVYGGSGDDSIDVWVERGAAIETPMKVDAGDGNDVFFFGGNSISGRAVAATGGAGRDLYQFTGTGTPAVTITDFQGGAGGDIVDLFSMLPPSVRTNPFAEGGWLQLVQDGSNVQLLIDPDGASGELLFRKKIIFENTTLAAFTADNFTEGVRPDGSSKGLEMDGTPGVDYLVGKRLDDTLRGGGGGDSLLGGEGNDRLLGGDGNDRLEGGAGNDWLEGGAGNDTLVDSAGENLLEGGDGNDDIRSHSSGASRLHGGAGDDYLAIISAGILDGGTGNDILQGGPGNDTVIGGEGADSVRLRGTRADYDITLTDDGYVVTDRRRDGFDGTDTLIGVERFNFNGLRVAFDLDGAAGQAYRLYRAAFDRVPDDAGVGYWMGALDRGSALVDIAAGFIVSKEFKDKYGVSPANADLVGRLYENILDRAPDPGGYEYWLAALDNGTVTLPQVLAMFSESAENREAVAGLIAQGIVYETDSFL